MLRLVNNYVLFSVGSDPTDSAFVYFLVAIIVLLLTGVCYLLLQKNVSNSGKRYLTANFFVWLQCL